MPDHQANPTRPIADYYDDTLIDYNAWSREGYLHFGYWRPWLNPFSRRPMLEEMNRLIFKHLHLSQLERGSVADLGCGVGAVSRFGSRLFPNLEFHALSISPGQIAEARLRHSADNTANIHTANIHTANIHTANIHTANTNTANTHTASPASPGGPGGPGAEPESLPRVSYYCGDYHQIPLPTGSVDGVFFLESLCHSPRPDEALAEAARILKPGGRIVLTDGYLTRPLQQTSPLFRYVVRGVAHNWAVPMFHEIELARQWTGGGRLQLVEEFECGWRLGPSALHAAHLSLFHFVKLLLQRKANRWQWRHLTASAFTIALGLYRRHFRYHLLAFERLDD